MERFVGQAGAAFVLPALQAALEETPGIVVVGAR
jgi:hypothetical protein